MTVADSLRNSLVYETNSVASQIDADIAEMREFDRENEKKESLFGWLGCGGVLFAIAAFVGLLVMQEQAGFATAAGVGIGIGVVVAAVGFIVRGQFGKFNLDDMRYLFLGEIVRLLKTDMRPEDPFQVRLSFKRHNDKSNFERNGHSGSWKVKYYKNPWIVMSGRLLDGARFTISMVEKHQDRSKTKRSASGKTKYKTKTKSGGEATVILRFKEKRYPQFAAHHETLVQAVQLPEGVVVKTVDVTNESIKIQVKALSGYDGGDANAKAKRRVRLATAMLLSCYHILNQSRRAAS